MLNYSFSDIVKNTHSMLYYYQLACPLCCSVESTEVEAFRLYVFYSFFFPSIKPFEQRFLLGRVSQCYCQREVKRSRVALCGSLKIL